MTYPIDWSVVADVDVMGAIAEYDELGAEKFLARTGFAPATTYQLVWQGRSYPPKAILGRAYEMATTTCLAARDFEGGKSGAVKVLTRLGFDVQLQRGKG